MGAESEPRGHLTRFITSDTLAGGALAFTLEHILMLLRQLLHPGFGRRFCHKQLLLCKKIPLQLPTSMQRRQRQFDQAAGRVGSRERTWVEEDRHNTGSLPLHSC